MMVEQRGGGKEGGKESATGIQISEGPGSGLYVRTFRVSTDGLIAKHTFKCQR